MPVLGTTTDSNFYHRQAAQMGDALRLFVDNLHQRRAEKEAKEQAEINSAFKAMQDMPELADTWGNDITRKYGKKYPELESIVATIRQRYRLQQEVPEAGKRFEDLWGRKEADFQAQQENLARMPDTVAADLPFGFGIPAQTTVQLPNPHKAEAQKAISQVRPELFSRDAWNELPPHQRLAALPYMKAHGYEIPEQTPFDPFGQLSEKSRGMLAVERGYVPPESETAKVIRGEGGRELTPEEIAKEKFSTAEREAREAHDKQQREESHRLQVQRINLQSSLRAAAEARQISGQKEIIDYRQSKKGDGGGEGGAGLTWKPIVADSKAAAAEWDAKHTAALAGLREQARADANAAFIKENGNRPSVIGEVPARRIAREVRGRKLDGEAADQAIVEMSATYMAEKARKGVSEQEALNRALGKSKALTPEEELQVQRGEARTRVKGIAEARKRGDTPTTAAPTAPIPKKAPQKEIFTEVKDDKWRSWAVAEYLARIEAGAAPDEAKAAVDAALRSKGKM
jgi:hypothetical protein